MKIIANYIVLRYLRNSKIRTTYNLPPNIYVYLKGKVNILIQQRNTTHITEYVHGMS